jgi:hypothetical protein
VSAAGGACTELGKADPALPKQMPVFLPDGDHFLYVQGGADEAHPGVYVASLRDPTGRRLLADPSSALFVPNAPGLNQGRLLFVREQTLMAQAFDAASLQLAGEPVVVANQVGFTSNPSQIAASAATDGTLIYLANAQPERQLVWYDRTGAEVGRAAKVTFQNGVSLSPDGTRVAFFRMVRPDPPSLWIQDLERNQETKLTTPPIVPVGGGGAVWSPDGQRLAFRATNAAAVDGIYMKKANGGAEELLVQGTSTSPVAPSDWSRDGHWLVYSDVDPKTGADIWLLPDPSTPTAARKPNPLVRTPATESQAQISPDGQWLAYYSDESGMGQVYLRPFNGGSPGAETKWQVSTSTRASDPRWRADGKELFYLEPVVGTRRLKLMSVPIGSGPSPAGTPKLLFEFQSFLTVPQANVFTYSPSADGQRFLINVIATDVQPSLEVILNWAGSGNAR